MRHLPTLFKGSMVRAIMADRKTKTRRIAKGTALEWLESGFTPEFTAHTDNHLCLNGMPGDTLWVREQFSGPYEFTDTPPGLWPEGCDIWYWADGNPPDGDWTRPKPSIHMPSWASRLLLEVVSVKLERLHDITETEALEEGIEEVHGVIISVNCDGGFHNEVTATRYYYEGCPEDGFEYAVDAFMHLWESINGKGSWDANPWVWVVEFKRNLGLTA